MTTIAGLLLARAGDTSPGLAFEDSSWTWAQAVEASLERAALLQDLRRPGPFHVGVLLDNVPEYSLWLGAAALAGAAIVGINPTHRGAELRRDLTHTECQLVVTEPAHRALLEGTGLGDDRLLDVASAGYQEMLARAAATARGPGTADTARGPGTADTARGPGTAGTAGTARAGRAAPTERSLHLLLFTSGTSGAPKACICSQGRLAMIGARLAEMMGLGARDVCYLAMPMFHSNALMAGWAPALAAGATIALRRRFSASQFLPDVRRFGATYFNYVGKPLSYVLATPARADDADNPLERVFGNEAADLDLARFSERFGCRVVDGYGSTEGGVNVSRTPDTPPGALGRSPEGTVVLDPATGAECPPARFDESGRLANAGEAIGELANRAGSFEGYWNNDEADAERVRDGVYWSSDLAYRDERGFVYFAGRDHEWLRVDGENFAAAPVERVLARHPDVVLAAVYAVPDPVVGDQTMAALQLRPGCTFDPVGFARFLAGQDDLGAKWAPRFVRVADRLPATQTTKILKHLLRRERWECDDPLWSRPGSAGPYRRLWPEDVAELRRRFEERGRLAALDAV